ncbi:MAG: hypothetical protein MR675_09115 [Lachnospira sp.]|nr:hypothetical protein [Lachnospira sp.]
MKYTCSVCGDTYTKSIEKTVHKYVDKVVKPTYTEDGYTEHTCSSCGYSYRDNYVDAIVPVYESVDITVDNWRDYFYIYEAIVPSYDSDNGGIKGFTYYYRLALKPEIVEKLNPEKYTIVSYSYNFFLHQNSTVKYDFSSGNVQYLLNEGWTKKEDNKYNMMLSMSGKLSFGGKSTPDKSIYSFYTKVDNNSAAGEITMNTLETNIEYAGMDSISGKLYIRVN